MYLHAYGKSGLEIATNTVAFATECFPWAIQNNLSGGAAVLAAFTVEIKAFRRKYF